MPTVNYQFASPLADLTPIIGLVNRLQSGLRAAAWLAGVSDQERAFIESCADAYARAKDGDTDLMVFADWLAERGRDGEASRLRQAAAKGVGGGD
jgi:hypothetical protein